MMSTFSAVYGAGVISRRAFVLATAGAALGPALWTRHLTGAAPLLVESRLGPPDQFGVRLQPGFRSRLLARSGSIVSGTDFPWHRDPDGAAVFPTPGGGWVYASNSEVPNGGGGVSTLEFDASGEIIGARSILTGTSRNCAGGPTPWGTWLSCEEVPLGQVYECDPHQPDSGVLRSGLGSFNHEAAAVDPMTSEVYLTEDRPIGRLYRFVPDSPGDLGRGQLFAASIPVSTASMKVGDESVVTWIPTSSAEPDRQPITSGFDGGEGAWIDDRRLLFTSKGDIRVWTLDLDSNILSVLHDCVASPDTPLSDVDNIVVHQGSGDIYVAEDQGDMQLCVVSERPNQPVRVDAFLQLVDQDTSEITGLAFSPDGQRLYFASQRGTDGRGLIYEITGPFPRPVADGLAPTSDLSRAERIGR